MLILTEHFNELKFRLVYIFLGFSLYFILFYCYAAELFYILAKPLMNLIHLDKFIYTNLVDVFLVEIQLAFFFSLFLTLMLLGYHLVCFLSPGLYNFELRNLLKILSVIFLFFFSLLFLFYFLFIPVILIFFFNLGTNFFELINLVFEARITEYFELIFKFLFFYIFIVQLPLCGSIYLYFQYLNYTLYKRNRLIFYMFILIYVLIFSPPDVLSQLILMFYLIFCIEIFIFCECIYKGYINKNKPL